MVSLRRVKEDVREVSAGAECGILIDGGFAQYRVSPSTGSTSEGLSEIRFLSTPIIASQLDLPICRAHLPVLHFPQYIGVSCRPALPSGYEQENDMVCHFLHIRDSALTYIYMLVRRHRNSRELMIARAVPACYCAAPFAEIAAASVSGMHTEQMCGSVYRN